MRRSRWYVIVGTLVLAMLVQVAYWRIASGRLRDGVQDWLADRRAHGWTVEAGTVSIGGWPLAAVASLPRLVLGHAGADLPGELNWTGTGIKLSVALLRPTVLDVALAGHQRISAGRMPEIVLAGADLGFSVPLQPESSGTVTVHGTGLVLEPATGAWRATVGQVMAQAALTDPRDAGTRAMAFSGSAEAVVLPVGRRWPLGTDVTSFQLEGTLNGPLPAVNHATDWAEAWRDGGGSLEVRHVTLEWGPLVLTTSATLALDEQLQPMGSGSARVVGYAEALDRLSAAGVLTKSASTVAKAVLSLLAGTGDGATPGAVDVPLTLQYRTLSMRQVPLVRLPELDWPAR